MAKAVRGTRAISEETVRARTGRSSKQWRAILDRWGAKDRGHTATAKHLAEAHGLDPWWSQTVAVRYEYERGLRTDVLAVPADLTKALAKSPAARAAFDRLPPSHRREYVEWIEQARRPETRARRVERSIARLAAGEREPRG